MWRRYVQASLRQKRARTLLLMASLCLGIAVVTALLGLIDIRRQFSLYLIGREQGEFDAVVTLADTNRTRLFDPVPVEQAINRVLGDQVQIFRRINGEAEAVKLNEAQGAPVVVVGADTQIDKTFRVTRSLGTYPPGPGEVFLSESAASAMKVRVGDDVRLSYVFPRQRDTTRQPTYRTSSRVNATLKVAGIGSVQGVGSNTKAAVVNLDDMQRWLDASGLVERLLIVWRVGAHASFDAQATVTQARDLAINLDSAMRAQVDGKYHIELPKYLQLEARQDEYIFSQLFVAIYGILSLSVVGLMINTLMATKVAEQRRDFGILRLLGAPQVDLFGAVVFEVLVLGLASLLVGLLLGRLASDVLLAPLVINLASNEGAIHPQASVESLIIPAVLTIVILIAAALGPARLASATKVAQVLNPATEDHPRLEDISKLRDRRPSLLVAATGTTLLALAIVILFVFPAIQTMGNSGAQAAAFYMALVLMVIGAALVFYFVSSPLERMLLNTLHVVRPGESMLVRGYTLRSKTRSKVISLMIVGVCILPSLLAVNLSMQSANLETDVRFALGADARITPGFAPDFEDPSVFSQAVNFEFFDPAAMRDLSEQQGVQTVVGLAANFREEVMDTLELRRTTAAITGVQGDLSQVIPLDLADWSEGDSSALAQLAMDRNAVIVSAGMAGRLDLHMGSTLRVHGLGLNNDHDLTIIGIARRLPGFPDAMSSNVEAAARGESVILVNIDRYRRIYNMAGEIDESEPLINQVWMRFQDGVPIRTMARWLRGNYASRRNINAVIAQETIDQNRGDLESQRLFTLALAALSTGTATLSVFTVLYASMHARKGEIGLLRAIGASQSDIRLTFIGETIVITLAAALSGVVSGSLLGIAFELSSRVGNETPVRWSIDTPFIVALIVAICVTAVASAALAIQPILRRKPVQILRHA